VSIKVSGVRYGTNTKENQEDTDDSESYQENSSATEEKDETQSAGGSSRSSRSSNLVRIGIEKFNAQMEPVLKRLLGICFLTIVALSAASIALNVIWAMESVGRFTITHDMLSSISQVKWGIISCEYASAIFKSLDSFADKEEEKQKLFTDLTEALHSFDNFMDSFYKHKQAMAAGEADIIEAFDVVLMNTENEPKNMDIKEALHTYAWVVNHILNSTLDQLKDEAIYFKFFENNVHSNLQEKLINVSAFINGVQRHSEVYMKQVEFIVTLGTIIFSALISFVCFIPSIYMNGKQKVAVYNLFESIEVGNLRNVFSQCTIKLTEMAGAEETQSQLELLDVQDSFKKSSSHKSKSGDDSENKKEKKSLRRSSLGQLRFGLSDVLGSSVMAKLSIITALTAVYFICFYAWWEYENEIIFSHIDNRVVLSNFRRSYCREIITEFLKWEYDPSKINTTYVEEKEKQLWEVAHAFSYGDQDYGIGADIRVLKGGAEVVDSDVCLQITHDIPILKFASAPCKVFQQGIMTRGAHEVVLSYITKSTALRSQYNLYRNKSSLFNPDDFESRIQVLKEMEQVWVTVAVIVSDEFLDGSFKHEFEFAKETRNVGIVAYILVSVLMFVFVYYPMVKDMDVELKGTRRGLMIIPNETVESSEVLRLQMRKIALSILRKT
jgi:tRNA-binding EMAP/Myf-like protein